MLERLSRVVNKISKSLITLTAATVLALSGLAAAGPLLASRAFADTPDVCPSGCTYSSIQSAINAASPGDTVTVGAGTYTENVAVNQAITLISAAGAAATTIVATDANHAPLTFSADGATVSGFTLTHSYTSAELSAWSFNNNGVTFSQLADGNTLENSTVTLNRNGIYLNNSENNVITGNTITNNRTGINMLNDLAGTKITNNVISDNWTEGLVTYGYSGSIPVNYSTITVTGNTFDNNWYEEITVKDAYSNSGTLDVSDNTFTDSPVTYTTSSDVSLNEPGFAAQQPVALGGTATEPSSALPTLRIYDSSPVTLAYSHPKTLNVTSGQYTTIQSAVDDAAAGDTVSVAAGTYNEAINITKPLSLVGQSRDGVVVNQTAATPYGYGVSVVGVSGVSISNMTFNVAAGAPVNYALQAYQASNVSLTNLVFSGPGKTGLNSRGSKIGGVDVNSSSNISYSNVQVSGFSKNGFSVTAKYSAGDTASSSLSFSNVNATGNNWAGLAFYNVNSSGNIGSNISNVSFSGNNVFSDNGQGVFVEGDSDANFGANNTPRYGISAPGGGNAAIHNSMFSGNGQAIVNYQTNGLDASLNYWGSASPDFGSLISGSGVTTTPYFTNAAMTTRSDAKVLPDNSGNATANSVTPQVVVTDSSQPVTITVTPGTTNASIDYSALVSGNTGTIPQTTINSSTADVSIPASTIVTATGGTWDGTITAPTSTTVSLGSDKTVAAAVEVGADGLHLTFSNAVRLLLPGQAGKLVGFVRNGDFTQISNACSADSQAAGDALPADGDCYVNVGSDMVIWTKHFTTFVAYSNTTPAGGGSNTTSSGSPSGSTGSSSGTSSGANSENGVVQGESTENGKTSSTNTEAPVASLAQPKTAAKEANGGGLRWYWIVLIVLAVIGLALAGVYRYAEGTDKA